MVQPHLYLAQPARDKRCRGESSCGKNKIINGTFDNHVPKYLYLKIPKYFAFRCFVMPYYAVFGSPKLYQKIGYFKSRLSSIHFQKETALFVKCALNNQSRKAAAILRLQDSN